MNTTTPLDPYRQAKRDLWLAALPDLHAAIDKAGLEGPLSLSEGRGSGDDRVLARYGSFDSVEFAADARRLTDTLGRPAQTETNDGRLDAYWFVGEYAAIEYTLWSDVCTQVVVGTERKVVREEVRPAEYAEVEKDVDIVEWRCPEGLFDDLLATKGSL